MTAATATRTTTRSKARERPALPLAGIGAPKGTGAPERSPQRAARKAPAGCAVPVHREPPGVLSFRYGLADHERAVIDAACTILGTYLREPGATFANPDSVKTYIRLHLAGERRELFAVLYLDCQNRLLALETPFAGTLTQTSVYPREIVRAALAHDAAAVVFAHNHPSGNPNPSLADAALTQTLKAALALVDVRVLDHIIIAGSEALSMAEKGLL